MTCFPWDSLDIPALHNPTIVSFLGQVNTEASTASSCTGEERLHNDLHHNAPEALEPASPNQDTPHTRTNHPATDGHKELVLIKDSLGQGGA